MTVLDGGAECNFFSPLMGGGQAEGGVTTVLTTSHIFFPLQSANQDRV